jgi:hypothetical protein
MREDWRVREREQKPDRRAHLAERMQRKKLRFAADPLGVTSFGIREESRIRNED